jgi:hypothetical protein
MCIILATGRLSQVDQEFKAVWTTKQDPVSKKIKVELGTRGSHL